MNTSGFKQSLENQGVTLKFLAESSFSQYYNRYAQDVIRDADGLATWPPTVESYALSRIADYVENNPDMPMADKPVHLGLLPADFTSQSLGQVINASLIPARKRRFGLPDFTGVNEAVDNCSAAETGFLSTIDALRAYAASDGPEPNVRVIVDKAMRPLLLQKSIEIGSVLTLQAVSVNGVPFPPGSIMAIRFEEDVTKLPKKGVEVMTKAAVTGMSFLRLSYFALPFAERHPSPHFVNPAVYTTGLQGMEATISTAVAKRVPPESDKFSWRSVVSGLLRSK